MLAAAPHTAYIHEPFNFQARVGVTSNLFKYWFEYICEENPDPYEAAIGGILHYDYPLASNLVRMRTAKDAARIARDQWLFLLHKIRKDTPIIKDPIAFFSAEWLSKTFDMQVLVMIRHPAAFCSSLKIKNWTFDFSNFSSQPLLMKRYLRRFEKEICEYAGSKRDLIDQAILLWNCIHHTIRVYQHSHPSWLFVRHEDLSSDPVNQFRAIYEALGLEFTHKSKSVIMKNSGSHNPVEQQAGNEFMRNSRENISNWKSRLSRDEINLIREKTLEVATAFYAEDEW